jgi:NADH-quinone oxidoreductase subunit M
VGLLTLLIFVPLLGAVAVAFTPRGAPAKTRSTAMVAALITFVVAVVVTVNFEVGESGFQMVERVEWIPQWGIAYHIGIDGIVLLMVLLTTFMTPLVILAAWEHVDRVKGYLASFLVLEAAVLGVFLALDLFLFYVFWELTIVPMYFIIGIWGYARRRYAAVKFFLYTFLGGLFMLLAILVTFAHTGAGTFDYLEIREIGIDPAIQLPLFAAFSIAFFVKIPIWPVHTWLPDAHTEAPTGGSVILAAVLLKLGAFGLLRYSLPLLPDATVRAMPVLLAIGVIGIVYGALVALVQRDLKKLVAYSSVSHMGFVVVGIFAMNEIAVAGGVIQMVNHGLSTGALFFLVGFLYERRHTRQIAAFGGLAQRTPVYAGLFLVVALSSLALPGLNGFVGEFPILLGAFQTSIWAAAGAAFGMVFAALYLLWAYQRVFHGPLVGADNENTTDLRAREVWVLAPLVILIVAIGVYPQPLFDRVEPAVAEIVQSVNGGVEAADVDEVEPAGGPSGEEGP